MARRERSRGSALVEIMIATLLTAIVTAGVFMAILSSRRSVERSDNRVQATAAAKRLIDRLGNYATPISSPADALAASMAPGGSWSLKDNAGATVCPGWALANGTNCDLTAVTDFLPPEFRNNSQATLNYQVADVGGLKQITVTVTWQDIQ